MKNISQGGLLRQQWVLYGTAFFASLFYALLTYLAPQAGNSFGLSKLKLLLLQLTIVIPYALTWFFSAYGLSTLGCYIEAAKSENIALVNLLRNFKTGLLWIVSGTILSAIVGGIKMFFMTDNNILPPMTIVINYLYIFPSLIGFIAIYRGVLQLRLSKEVSGNKPVSYIFTTFIVLLISGSYVYLLYTNPTRQFSADPTIPATYFLPDSLILITIVLPIIVSWWLGFYSVFTMSDLVPYLTGVGIFKGLTRILYGTWSIIFASIIIQALLSLGTARLYSVGLTILLLVIYMFIILQGMGYLLIALGSNSLQKSLNENINI